MFQDMYMSLYIEDGSLRKVTSITLSQKNSAKEQIQIVLQYNRVKLYTPAPADFVTEYQKYKNTEFGQIAVQYIKTVMSYTNSCSKCGAFAAHDSALISLCPTLD